MLTEIAIADAYGAGFEFCAAEKIRLHNNLELYYICLPIASIF